MCLLMYTYFHTTIYIYMCACIYLGKCTSVFRGQSRPESRSIRGVYQQLFDRIIECYTPFFAQPAEDGSGHVLGSSTKTYLMAQYALNPAGKPV